jgi:uncharacterized coiled-coil DUF342 family protein
MILENLEEINEIENLKAKINEINEKINELINEKSKIIEERNKYLQTLKILKSEVYQLRIGKNNLNERIKKIIEEIRLTKKSLLEDINKIKELKNNIKSLNKPNLSIENIKKRIEKNEWIIQTELLTPFEEKKLYEEIRKLEKLLIDAEKIKEMNNEINRLSIEINNKKEIINKNALELQKLKEKRNKIFNELKPLLENYKNIENEIIILSEKYNDIKNKHRFLEAEKILLNSKLIELMYKIKSKKEEELKKKEAEIKKKIKEEALMKIKNGKKLTFEEFKILFEDQESIIK